MRRGLQLAGVLFLAGCATQAPQRQATSARTLIKAASLKSALPDRRYLDLNLGFEIARPGGNWQLSAADETTSEGLAVPVVLRHRDTGAEVILQIAPAVATPTQFAERLTVGLRSQPGFSSTDPEPLPLSDNAVGFRFSVGASLRGRVAVLEGRSGQMMMMMGTWPTSAPPAVASSVNEIFGSLKAIPVI